MWNVSNKTLAKCAAVAAVLPLLLLAYSTGPDPRHTGAPGDATCAAAGCHTGTAVNGGTGKVEVTFPSGLTYTPGQTQRLRVTVSDPTARRWGFQLTARPASDETNGQAGSFNSVDANTQVLCARTTVGDAGIGKTAGQACPSTRPLEFVEHTQGGTRNGTTGSISFEFDWVAPATDVGTVRVYVAANAANGNTQESGDKIYTANYTLTAAAGGGNRPAISQNGVVNAAGSASPASTITSNGFLSIYGTNLSTATMDWGNSFTNGRAPTTLNGVSVKVNNKDAFVSFVSAGQINAVVPDDDTTGPVTVQVTTAQGTSEAVTVQKQTVSPAFFTYNQNSKFYVSLGDTNSRRPGQEIALYANGFGPLTGNPATGSVPGAIRMQRTPTVTVGGQPATVTFAGVNGFVGVYQINIVVPNVSTGDQEIIALVDGVRTPSQVYLKVGN